MAGLFDIFTNTNAQNAANDQQLGLQRGLQNLTQSFGQGQGALTSNYTAGLQPALQNFQNFGAGVGQYGNALGLGGAEGNAAALQGFQNNPGYQFQLEQGNENILRNQAQTGQLASGKTNLDLQKFGQGLANQSWQQYLQNLQPYLGAAGNAAGQIGSMYGSLGNQLNANMMGQGNAQYGAYTGMGNAQANAELANNQASANMWGLGMNAAKLATGGLGGGFGGNLFGNFNKIGSA